MYYRTPNTLWLVGLYKPRAYGLVKQYRGRRAFGNVAHKKHMTHHFLFVPNWPTPKWRLKITWPTPLIKHKNLVCIHVSQWKQHFCMKLIVHMEVLMHDDIRLAKSTTKPWFKNATLQILSWMNSRSSSNKKEYTIMWAQHECTRVARLGCEFWACDIITFSGLQDYMYIWICT